MTASAQTALEAKVSGAKVIFINTPDTLYPETLLSEYGIIIVEGFDSEAVTQHLQNNLSTKVQKRRSGPLGRGHEFCFK